MSEPFDNNGDVHDGDGGVPARGPTRRDLGVHAGELKLRRFLAGESLAAEPVDTATHVAACVDCARRLEALREEQRSFEERVSFDRFSAGVERAARVPAPARASAVGPRGWGSRLASKRAFLTVTSMGALAAAIALLVGSRSLFESAVIISPTARNPLDLQDRQDRPNRIKGAMASAVLVQVATGGDANRPNVPNLQRTVASDAPEPLGANDRIRIAVQPGTFSFLFAISIDDQGVVTALYPQAGSSLPLGRAGAGMGMTPLPDSLELTGKGAERLVVVLTNEPLTEPRVREAAGAAFRAAGGDLRRLTKLALGGEQFHRLFIKP